MIFAMVDATHSSNTLIFLMGPTACGKSALALEMAQRLNGEIISVDSALVYKGMDIGTAKPSVAEQKEIKHHLIDICDPSDPYNVADFCKDAKQAINDILSRNKIPLLVGGTMMYFNALRSGLSSLPETDLAVRLMLFDRLQKHGLDFLYQQLHNIDPESAQQLHANDTQRILRALEVYESTGIPLRIWQISAKKQQLNYDIRALAVMPADREVLHHNIAQRFDAMLEQGFLQEMEHLFNRGDLSPDLPSMRAVGYRQAWEYYSCEIDLPTMRAKCLAATRQLAKRQVTWLRKWPDLTWFVPNSLESILSHCNL